MMSETAQNSAGLNANVRSLHSGHDRPWRGSGITPEGLCSSVSAPHSWQTGGSPPGPATLTETSPQAEQLPAPTRQAAWSRPPGLSLP